MSDDPRPRSSICHVRLTATDPSALGNFDASVGMHLVAKMANMSILGSRKGRVRISGARRVRPEHSRLAA